MSNKKLLILTIIILCCIAVKGLDKIENHLEMPFSFSAKEQVSPANHISEDAIKVYDDKVLILVEGAEWASFTNTNSMDPTFDEDANAIEIIPKFEEDISVGDIISYEFSGTTIIHRVVFIGEDASGWYCKVKGDNNAFADPLKIRFSHIKRIVVAIIY